MSDTPATSISDRAGRAATHLGQRRRRPARPRPRRAAPEPADRAEVHHADRRTRRAASWPPAGRSVGSTGRRARTGRAAASAAPGPTRDVQRTDSASAPGTRAARQPVLVVARPPPPGRSRSAPIPSGWVERAAARGSTRAAGFERRPGGVVARAEGEPAVVGAGDPLRRLDRQPADRAAAWPACHSVGVRSGRGRPSAARRRRRRSRSRRSAGRPLAGRWIARPPRLASTARAPRSRAAQAARRPVRGASGGPSAAGQLARTPPRTCGEPCRPRSARSAACRGPRAA